MLFEIIAIVAGVCILLFLLIVGISALFRHVKKKRDPQYVVGSAKKPIIIGLTVGISLFMVSVCILLFCVFYFNFFAWEPKGERTYRVGDEWKSETVSSKLDSVDCVTENDTVEVTTSFTVTPTVEWGVEEQDVYLRIFNDRFPVNNDKSVEKSGSNVFETKMTEETVCVFVFDVPFSVFHNNDGTEIKSGLYADVFAFSFPIISPYSNS